LLQHIWATTGILDQDGDVNPRLSKGMKLDRMYLKNRDIEQCTYASTSAYCILLVQGWEHLAQQRS